MQLIDAIEQLDRILAEMQSWTGSGDFEVAHSQADALLIQVLELIASHTDDPVSITLHQIVDAWQRVEKWYA